MTSKPKTKASEKKSQGAAAKVDDLSTREKLLNSAEILFATRGYEGTSTRAIANEADVPLGLMSYYFGTKKDLYAEVIKRRSSEHTQAILGSLEEVGRRMDTEDVSTADLVKAFIAPVTKRLQGGDTGWRSYIKLLSLAANTPNSEPHARVFFKEYARVVDTFVDLMKRKYPKAREEDIYWAFYILNSAFIHILVENKAIDRISHDTCRSSDLETVTRKMSVLFDAGIEKLVNS